MKLVSRHVNVPHSAAKFENNRHNRHAIHKFNKLITDSFWNDALTAKISQKSIEVLNVNYGN